MKCQKHLVTQYHCQREATVIRETPSGKQINLCETCDNAFGETVGKLIKKSAVFHGVPSSVQPVSKA